MPSLVQIFIGSAGGVGLETSIQPKVLIIYEPSNLSSNKLADYWASTRFWGTTGFRRRGQLPDCWQWLTPTRFRASRQICRSGQKCGQGFRGNGSIKPDCEAMVKALWRKSRVGFVLPLLGGCRHGLQRGAINPAAHTNPGTASKHTDHPRSA